jgi:hypothetical protein
MEVPAAGRNAVDVFGLALENLRTTYDRLKQGVDTILPPPSPPSFPLVSAIAIAGIYGSAEEGELTMHNAFRVADLHRESAEERGRAEKLALAVRRYSGVLGRH